MPRLPPPSPVPGLDAGAAPVRLHLTIPHAALMKQFRLPSEADPWKIEPTDPGSTVYAFLLTSLVECQAAIRVAYGWGLKPERMTALGWGTRLTFYEVRDVLSCLERSYQADDYRAYCWRAQRAVPIEQEVYSSELRISLGSGKPAEKIVRDRSGRRIHDPLRAPIWLHPCRLAAGWTPLTTYHPASIPQQIEAGLVAKGCRWCPRLDDLSSWVACMWGEQTHAPSGPIVPTPILGR